VEVVVAGVAVVEFLEAWYRTLVCWLTSSSPTVLPGLMAAAAAVPSVHWVRNIHHPQDYNKQGIVMRGYLREDTAAPPRLFYLSSSSIT